MNQFVKGAKARSIITDTYVEVIGPGSSDDRFEGVVMHSKGDQSLVGFTYAHWNKRYFTIISTPETDWISVKDRLPEVGEYVLVTVNGTTVFKGRLLHDGWVVFFADGEQPCDNDISTVTHWQPLPSPPPTKTNQ